MIIDCDRCDVRGDACGDCVIGVLMDTPEIDRPIPYLPVDLPGEAGPAIVGHGNGGPAAAPLEFAEPERRALEVLADQGLIPRLRLVERARPGAAGPEGATMLPMPVVPHRHARHRDAG
ncbi:hypothetical protein WIS52_17250 [Pseudonocardia nematodicida]|uniref:Uncharacterized protein n=1 Tax=Pseudonocardia nematodicida TaxID=1206997 RepID=A0ABV1KCM0_9PSEU